MNFRRRRWSDYWKTGTNGSWTTGSSKNIDRPFSPSALHEALQGRLGLPLTTSFVVAYSGGCDSHALLHALHALRPPRLRVIHIDHGLQAAAAAWAAHCLETCAALQLHCHIERIDVRRRGEESTEAAARRLRYQALAAHVAADDVLLTAHHEDDQAETVLLQLLRGAGAHGLAAMPALQPFGAGRHARPLLGFSRAALAAYARAQKLSWIDDTSNRDEHMSRNFVRAQVLPLLETRWPAAARTIARAAAHGGDIAAMLDEIGDRDLARCVDARTRELSIDALRTLSVPRQRNLVRHWIRRHGLHAPSAQHLQQILQLARHDTDSGLARVDWPEAEVHRYREALIVRARTPPPDRRMVLPWQPPQAIEVPGTGWRLRAIETVGEGVARARLAQAPVTLRLRQGGERCQLAGHAHRHQLKKLLQEAGVPPWERDRLPLIYAGEALAAIGDRWVCAPFAAQPHEPGWRIVLESVAPDAKAQSRKE
jgi:tRNA(Ile)-lysidine synthase